MSPLILTVALLGAGGLDATGTPSTTAPVQSGILQFSRIGDRDVEFLVMPDDVRGTPPWTRDADNPAVSARTAISKAAEALTVFAKQVPLDEKFYSKDSWSFESLKLVPVGSEDRWIWIATYEATGRSARSSVLRLHIAVLMNGDVVTPKVKEKKDL